VFEVISSSSVRKDTIELRDLYWQAGIPEYWLIDARHEPVKFDILRHGANRYLPTKKIGGWLKSSVFGRSFRLTKENDQLGNPQFTLASTTETSRD
jgi:Uma2 family endonuclease